MNNNRKELKFFESIKLLIGYFAVQVLLVGICIVAGLSYENPFVYIIIIPLSTIIVITTYSIKHEVIINQWYKLNENSFKIIIPFAIFIVGISIAVSELNNFILLLWPMNGDSAKSYEKLFGGEISLVGSIIFTALIAPIVEEIIFRGIILQGYLECYSAKKSIIISALLFSLVHYNIYQIPGALAYGIISGWLYVKTHSLVVCILGHAFYNSLGYLILHVLRLDIPGYTTDIGVTSFQPIWFDLLGLVLLIIGSILLKKRLKT